MREVFEILRTQKFFCRLHKCHFNDTKMKYLGHLISADGVRPNPNKVEKVKEWPRPTIVQEVKAFPGSHKLLQKVYAGIQPNGLASNRLDANQEDLELDRQMHRSI